MKHIYIIIQKQTVYLVNATEKDIKRLIYSSVSVMTFDDDAAVSSAATCEMENIPSNSFVCIEEVDPWEDGVVLYQADEILWADGTIEKMVRLNTQKLWGGGQIPGKEIELEKKYLSSKKSDAENNFPKSSEAPLDYDKWDQRSFTKVKTFNQIENLAHDLIGQCLNKNWIHFDELVIREVIRIMPEIDYDIAKKAVKKAHDHWVDVFYD
jgi:hypothetical protein